MICEQNSQSWKEIEFLLADGQMPFYIPKHILLSDIDILMKLKVTLVQRITFPDGHVTFLFKNI